ncbi:GntR family transcriptional regulator [Kineococcus sp. SYSU DK003]|uniref:GntR family transcriptional regulator n=1 Tax=Kineococcus sp. SYSU DK003 TaxID=3383124 RepID=UPI003D7DF574
MLSDVDEGAAEAGGRSGLLVAHVHARLREAVLGGDLAPGERLRDSVLAASLGVSRAPVREALRLLEHSGLVVKPPNRSYSVARFTDADLVELAGLRISQETLAARLVVRGRRSLAPAAAGLEDLRAAVDSGVATAVVRADRGFHEALVHCAGSRRLDTAYASLRDQVQLAMQQTNAYARGQRGMVERHARLLRELRAAVASHDPGAVIAELEAHVLEGMGCPGAL